MFLSRNLICSKKNLLKYTFSPRPQPKILHAPFCLPHLKFSLQVSCVKREMNQRERTSLKFHCGVCAKQLTDATALFTSCGHFFCFAPGAKCTRLQPGQASGRCEQCGKQCDSGDLTNQGSRYDARVRSFVFSDISEDLRNIADIVEVTFIQFTQEVLLHCHKVCI